MNIGDLREKLTKRTRAKEVTPAAYEKAYQMYAAAMSLADIQAGSGLTKKQVLDLVHEPLKGYEKECPAFSARIAERIAAQRTQAIKAAEVVGEQAAEWITEELAAAALATKVKRAILSEHGRLVSKELRKDPNDRTGLPTLAMPLSVVRTLKALAVASDTRRAVDVFQACYNTGSIDLITGAPRHKVDRENEQASPALIAAYTPEQDPESTDQGLVHVGLQQHLLPEASDWTDEQIEQWVETGKTPRALPPSEED